jgi:hypothetical protein
MSALETSKVYVISLGFACFVSIAEVRGCWCDQVRQKGLLTRQSQCYVDGDGIFPTPPLPLATAIKFFTF